MKTRPKLLWFAGAFVVLLGLWLVLRERSPSPVLPDRVVTDEMRTQSSRPNERFFRKFPERAFKSSMKMEKLAAEHGQTPTPNEWVELRRILTQAPPGELADAAVNRYVAHASLAELEKLREDFLSPLNDQVGQRVLEVFGSLQSPESLKFARKIFNDESLPVSDHLLNACALSLARYGQEPDVEAIFKRLDSAGEDLVPDGSLYSDVDGLVAAIGILRNPEIEDFLGRVAKGDVHTTVRSRAAAANALRHYPTVQSTTVLYQLSQNETNPIVRKRAEESLKWIRTPE